MSNAPGYSPTRPSTDSSNANATTQFVQNAMFNVLAFPGVDPTGATDSTAGIQAAINAAQAKAVASPFTGGIVYLPAGFYFVSSTLNITQSNISIIGDGQGRTIIVRSGAYADTFTANNGGQIQNITFRGMTLYHNIVPANIMSGAHIDVVGGLKVLIDDIQTQNGAYGIIFKGGVYLTVQNCHLQGTYNPSVASKNSTVGLYLINTTNPGAVTIPSIVCVNNVKINPFGSSYTLSAGASFTTASTTITMGATVPSYIISGMYITDLTNGGLVGQVYSAAASTVTLAYASQTNSTGSTDSLLFADYGWDFCCTINGCEEVHFTNCTFNGGLYSNVYLQQLSNNLAIYEVTFDSCFFDGTPIYSLWIDGSTGNGSNYISRIRVVNTGFNGELGLPYLATGGEGIYIDATSRGSTYPYALYDMQVLNCTFQAYYRNGVEILAGNDITFSGNTLFQNGHLSTGFSGLNIGAAVNRLVISNNIIGQIGAVTETQSYGISIANNTVVTNTVATLVTDNILQGNLTSQINDSTAAPTTNVRSTIITNNAGFNGGRAPTTPTVPATTINQYNYYGSPTWMYITGGTVTAVKVNGVNVATATPTSFLLGPMDYFSTTNTGAPTITAFPQ